MQAARDDTRFGFGRNWHDYAKTLTPEKIEFAVAGLSRLAGADLPAGHRFLDIGSGSGVHSLAALRLGAGHVVAVDVDADSVATTKAVLEQHAPQGSWECRQVSVFDLHPQDWGPFDVVYSWGVLHHTGQMWRAIDQAAAMVADGGLFVLAIYNKTPMCAFWTWEKRLYTRHRWLQPPILYAFNGLRLLRRATRGVNPFKFVREYEESRGMSFHHDGHDWLGGYPYESATPAEIEEYVSAKGYRLLRSFDTDPSLGLMGTGCAEYVFRRE